VNLLGLACLPGQHLDHPLDTRVKERARRLSLRKRKGRDTLIHLYRHPEQVGKEKHEVWEAGNITRFPPQRIARRRRTVTMKGLERIRQSVNKD
jgi:predicted DNA-binding transcriptional regulator